MKPAWDQLAAEFDGEEVIIGDVDCTVIFPAQGSFTQNHVPVSSGHASASAPSDSGVDPTPCD